MNDIIDDLVDDLSPAVPRRAGLIFVTGLALAATISLAIVLMFYGVRSDLNLAMQGVMFWIKAGIMLALMACAWPVLLRLSRPGLTAGPGLKIAALIAAGLVIAGLVNVLMAPSTDRMDLMLGHSWRDCVLKIAVVAAPLFAATMMGLRRLAPTRLREAGLAAGFVAGGAGAAIYSLSCTEESLTFLAGWYLLAVIIVAAIGALMGPRLLRW